MELIDIIDAFDVATTSVNEIAWKLKDAMSVLNQIGIKEHIVLGGDILTRDLSYTYDSWFYTTNSKLNLKENSAQSIQAASNYISNYMSLNGDNYYVVFVIKGQSKNTANTGEGSLS